MVLLKKLIAVTVILPIYALADCNTGIKATTPSSDFTVHNNGTVTHNKTGLMWKVCSEGQQAWSNKYYGDCAGDAATYRWVDAIELVRKLNTSGGHAGYTDWRLPNVKELASILEAQCQQPMINSAIFPRTARVFYWSSTLVNTSAYFEGPSYDPAMGIVFGTGVIMEISTLFGQSPVRLVRDTNPSTTPILKDKP